MVWRGAANLFVLDLDSARIAPLTAGVWKDEAPSWGTDGRIYFTSDRDGVLNVFSVDTLGEGRRETSAWSGAFDGVPLPDGSGLLVGGFHDLSWNLYRYPVDTTARKERFALEPGDSAGGWTWLAAGDTVGSVSATPRALSLPAHAGFRRRRRGHHPRLRRRPGRVLRHERSARRQPALRLDRLVPGPPARQHHLEHQRQRGLPQSVAPGELGCRRVPDQGPQLRGRPRRRLRRDRVRRARHHPLSAQPVQPRRRNLHRGALRPGGLHPAGGPASARGLDRHPLPELRPRQLALDQQRSDRRRAVQPHRRVSPTTSATAGSTATW